MSNIDISSISILIIILHILQVAALLLQFVLNRVYKGNGWWLLWSISVGTGMTFLYLRTIPGLIPHAIIIQNTFILLGLIFLYTGLMRFMGKRENAFYIYSAFGVYEILMLYFIYVEDNFHIRSYIFAAALLGISVLLAYTLFSSRDKSIRFSANFMGAVVSIHGSFYLIRILYLFINPQSGNYMSQDWNTVLQYILGIIIGLMYTFSLIFMTNQKLNGDMRAAKEHFETIFNTSPDAVIITRLTDGQIIDVNDAFCSITGFTREESLGRTTFEINVWKSPGDREKLTKQILGSSVTVNLDFEFLKKDGTSIVGLMSSSAINLNGVAHIISVIRDITSRVKAENELKQKNDELEEVNSEKDKLFSIISHDLKNSFNIFLGYTDLLAEDIENLNKQEIYSMAKNMNVSARNLYKLIANLLEWSVFKRGLTKVSTESLSLYRLVNEIVEQVQVSAAEKNISMQIGIPHDIFIMTDKSMAEIIFRNLLSNAVKFTERGGTISITSGKPSQGIISVTVKDSGIGMDEETRRNLFSLGRSSNRRGTENEPSTGLGLVLVRDYVTKLGGTISVESEEGKGSSFTVTFPVT